MKTQRQLSRAVIDHFGLDRSEFFGHTHRHAVAHPRQLYMRLARDEGYTATEIGRFLKRDHTTVVVGSQIAADRIENDPEWNLHARSILKKVKPTLRRALAQRALSRLMEAGL